MLPHSDPPQAILCIKYKICAYINTTFCSTLTLDNSFCKPSATVVSPPTLSTAVVNKVRRSESVVHNHRPLCWRRQSRTVGGPTFSAVRYSSFPDRKAIKAQYCCPPYTGDKTVINIQCKKNKKAHNRWSGAKYSYNTCIIISVFLLFAVERNIKIDTYLKK